MKALVVGCGKVGSEIVRDLASSREVDSVVAADVNRENLARVSRWEKVQTVKSSLGKKKLMLRLMKEADVTCGALPGRLGFDLLQMAAEHGHDIVDISYTPRDPFVLHRRASANDCILVPQCGVAPGLSNMCVGDASNRLRQMRAVRIYVGGLPQKPVPPLNYRVVFSLEDVMNEYTRPVRLIENGHSKTVEPLSGRGYLHFPKVGKLEFFLTDGLGTLTRSFPKVLVMREMTLRYRGHAEIITMLTKLGYFDRRKLKVNGELIEPREVSLGLLRSAFSAGTREDLLAFRVDVEGLVDGRRVLVRYHLLDRFDPKMGVSAMARTTAYPCTSVALLAGQGRLRERGVVPPEMIAKKQQLFRFVTHRLRAHGVRLGVRTRAVSNPNLL